MGSVSCHGTAVASTVCNVQPVRIGPRYHELNKKYQGIPTKPETLNYVAATYLPLKFGFDRTTYGRDRDTPKNTTLSLLLRIRNSSADQTRSPIFTRDGSTDALLVP